MVNLQNELEISDEKQKKDNEYGADRTSKAVTYLRSILHKEDPVRNKNRPSKVSCPKVPPILRDKERGEDNYDPRIVSLGPYHHGNPKFVAAQQIKPMFMQQIISEHEKSIEHLYIEVFKLNEYTRSCYVVGSTEKYGDEEFALMMLQDGCFILCFIELVTSRKRDYISMITDHLGLFEVQYLHQDILLLENQIPFRVLKVLMSNIFTENEGLEMVKSFLNITHWGKSQQKDTRDKNEEPVHLLGLLKSQISKHGRHKKPKRDNKDIDITSFLQSFGSVSDLNAKGINFKPSNSISLLSALLNGKPKSISLRNVDFRLGFFTGELKLPPLILDSDIQIYYMNLIAFELHTCTDFTVTSYIHFMNSLIASPEDVTALRSRRIILHSLSSDKEVFKMLKEMSIPEGLQDFSIYQDVRKKIERHCDKKIKIWIADIRHQYFSHPWSAISLLAAVVMLILIFLQTFFTIYPRKA